MSSPVYDHPDPPTRGPARDRSSVIGDGAQTMARWSLRLVLVAAGAVVVAYVIGWLWAIILPVLLALLVSTLLHPVADRLHRWGVPRVAAAALVVLAFVAVTLVILTYMATSVVSQVTDVASRASDGLVQVKDWMTGPPLNLSDSQLAAVVDAITSRLQDAASSIATGVFTGVSAVGNVVINAVLVLVLSFLFVKDGHRFLPWAYGVLGDRAGGPLCEVLGRCWRTLGAFIRTQVVVSFVDAVFIGIGLALLGVPLALTLATLTFFGGFIPIIGALVAGALAVLVALVTVGWGTALAVLALILVVQQIEGNVLSPMLQGKSLGLHAAVVLLAVTAGGTLFGITGAFLAVPAVATAAEVLRYLSERIGDTSEQQPQPVDPEPQRANQQSPPKGAD
ncbi:MAG: AI-2E family transporter [Nocardioidaceae bacterium]|jgi:predicted PurR-regulated permease PerM|nr:AI-2E family transporter [Nocardioidaceae bacterium]